MPPRRLGERWPAAAAARSPALVGSAAMALVRGEVVCSGGREEMERVGRRLWRMEAGQHVGRRRMEKVEAADGGGRRRP